jgi:hypothetical protein
VAYFSVLSWSCFERARKTSKTSVRLASSLTDIRSAFLPNLLNLLEYGTKIVIIY